jgi:D-tyrosyl-tRNA(Tyr) deacylase
MRAVVQRVSRAEVRTEGRVVSSIGKGFLILLAVGQSDGEEDAVYLAHKVLNLRVFEDEQGKMNLSVRDVQGYLLVVSQFTLYGDCRKGNRPSFTGAAHPDRASLLYQAFIDHLKASGVPVSSGNFQTLMEVDLVNQGPVTILLDSQKTF